MTVMTMILAAVMILGLGLLLLMHRQWWKRIIDGSLDVATYRDPCWEHDM